jgi:uncharacterized protein YdhG (YjbR/CyaY superfamily)
MLPSSYNISRMKKAKSSKRSSAAKGGGAAKKSVTPKNVDEYLAAIPQAARPMLQEMRDTIRSTAPKESTEVISYGIPAFKHKKILVWYAAFAKHCSLFPTASVLEQFKDDLKGYSVSKGTIQFPLDKPLPTALLKKLVKARVSQIGNGKD